MDVDEGGKEVRTGKTRGFLEGDHHFCRVLATVAEMQKERRISECVCGRCPVTGGFWGVGWYDNQRVAAKRTQETVPS